MGRGFFENQKEVDRLKATGVTDFDAYLNATPSFYEQIPAMMSVVDVNEFSLEIFAASTKQELIGNFSKIFLPETAAIFGGELQAIADGKSYFEAETQVQNLRGERIHILFSISFPVGTDYSHVLVSIIDITQRKLSEQALQQSEERFRMATKASGVGIWEWNVITNKIRWDAQMFRIYGVAPTADGFVAYSTWSNAVAPEDLSLQEKILQDTVKNVGTINRSFKIYRANDGILRFIDAIETVRTNAAGQAEWVVGTNLDVTEQKELTAKLNTTVDYLRLYEKVVVNTNDAVLITEAEPFDLPGPKILYVNDAFCKMSGYTKEEVIGKSPRILQGPKTDRKQLDKIRAALSKWQSVKVELINYTKDGREFYVEFEIVPLANDEGWFTHWVSVQRDVTERKMAELKILESEQRFQAAIKANKGILWTNNAKGEMEGEQPGWASLTGQTYAEYQSYGWAKAVHPDDAQPTVDAWNEAVKENKIFIFEHRVKTKDDGYRYFSIRAIPLLNADGTLRQWVGVHTDITEQKLFAKQLEQQVKERTADLATLNETLIEKNESLSISEDFNRSLTEVSPNVVYIHDIIKNEPVFLNRTGLSVIGRNNDEALGNKNLQEIIIHPEDLPGVVTIVEQIKQTKNNEVFEHEYRIKDAKGNWTPFLARDTVFKRNENNEVTHLLGIAVDISELKIAEKELLQKNSTLEKMNKELREEKSAKDKAQDSARIAEEAAKTKQRFLSTMSHEIRTPLTSIIGFANVLSRTELNVEQKEFVHAIRTSSKTLNVIINDVLDLAKVEAGKMTFEKHPFDIYKSIISIVHTFDLKIKEKSLVLLIEFDSKIPSMLLGDSVRLNQVILNLLSNAVKFTHKGKIIVSVKLLNEDDNNVALEFAVKDSGIGIADDKLESIFNAFEQAEFGTANAYGGTGLGLAITKQLIEAQGGSISLKSKIGEGSTFSFSMTFGKTTIESEEDIEIPILETDIKNLRVLVAEDVAMNRFLIKRVLSEFGFEHEIVSNGKIAIEKLQTNVYDIILMDLQMPEMDGYEATEYIRKTMKSQIPIIALTGDVITVDESKCKEFGMDDYVSKPIDEKLLLNKIMELVKRKA